MKRLIAWLLLVLALVWLAACETLGVRVETPWCPWPPPVASDTLSMLIPLGCPIRLDDSTIVVWGQ